VLNVSIEDFVEWTLKQVVSFSHASAVLCALGPSHATIGKHADKRLQHADKRVATQQAHGWPASCQLTVDACMWLWVWVRTCTGAGSDEHEPKSQQVLSRANPTTNPQDAKKCGLGMLQVARSVTNLLQVARSVERDKGRLRMEGGREKPGEAGEGGPSLLAASRGPAQRPPRSLRTSRTVWIPSEMRTTASRSRRR
jgi:hypothetical protein